VTYPSPGKVLITGASGQLGLELQASAPALWQIVPCARTDLDIRDASAVERVFAREGPAIVINTAAYTRVDDAEREPELARQINADGARNVAAAAKRVGSRLIHLSTDFVFDGSRARPYTPDDPARPLGAYGTTKLAGEREVAAIGGNTSLIVRTAWLYSTRGSNFVLTMLRLMKERESVGVVSDQVGTPTWALGLAQALWKAAERPDVHGILHWTDAGVASWYDFAVAIQEEALALELLPRASAVRALRSEEFPTAARRPAYSVLDKTTGWNALGGPAPHWRSNLRCMLQMLKYG
jgi:dTDP-4-dehydrorhamnose reductase